MNRYLKAAGPMVASLFLILITTSAAAQTAQEYYKKGNEYRTAKKYKEAIDAYKQATGLKKDYFDAWHMIAWCSNELAQYAEAETAALQAVKFKSNFAEAWLEAGYAQRKQKKYSEAVNSMKFAIVYKNKHTQAYREMGNIFKDQKNYDKALEYYLDAYTQDPQSHESCYQIGWLYNIKAKYNDAIPYLRSAIRLKQDHYQAFQELGYAQYKTSQYDSAMTNYKKAIAIKPDYAIPYRGLGDVYRLGMKPARVDDAMKQYKSALQYDSTSMGANFGLGWCYNEQKNYVLATLYLEKASKSSPSDATILGELAYSYYARGLYNDALAKCKQGIQNNASHKLCHYYAGLCYLAQKDRTNAQLMADKLRSLDAALAQKLQDGINKM